MLKVGGKTPLGNGVLRKVNSQEGVERTKFWFSEEELQTSGAAREDVTAGG